MITSSQGTTVNESVVYNTRKVREKVSVFVRNVTVTTKRTTKSIVGLKTKAEADQRAEELSKAAGNEDVEAKRSPSGMWSISYIHVSEKREYGEWYIPTTGA